MAISHGSDILSIQKVKESFGLVLLECLRLDPSMITRCLLIFVASLSIASAQDYVNGYTRQDGTQVGGYYRTAPNGNPYDNYSTRGNYNPYTGQPGTQNPNSGNSSGGGYFGGSSSGSGALVPGYPSRR